MFRYQSMSFNIHYYSIVVDGEQQSQFDFNRIFVSLIMKDKKSISSDTKNVFAKANIYIYVTVNV